MTLIDASITGMEMRTDMPGYDAVTPVDLAYDVNGTLVVCFSGWFNNDWVVSNGQGFAMFDVSREVDTSDDGPWNYVTTEGYKILLTTSLTDQDMADRITEMKAWRDLWNKRYIVQLYKLVVVCPNLNLLPLVTALERRVVTSPATAYEEKITEDRKIACIFLKGEYDIKSDVLVIDEFGSAATANDQTFLASLAESWGSISPRPELNEYVEWVKTQEPYGNFSWGNVTVTTGTGRLEEIAQRLFLSKEK